MINGKARDFIECLSYEDNYAIFHGHKYFFNGCQTWKDSHGKVICVKLEIYDLTNQSTIYSVAKKPLLNVYLIFKKLKFGTESPFGMQKKRLSGWIIKTKYLGW